MNVFSLSLMYVIGLIVPVAFSHMATDIVFCRPNDFLLNYTGCRKYSMNIAWISVYSLTAMGLSDCLFVALASSLSLHLCADGHLGCVKALFLCFTIWPSAVVCAVLYGFFFCCPTYSFPEML